jgi:hypothetical protein
MSIPSSVYQKLPSRMPYTWGFSKYALRFSGGGDHVTIADSPFLSAFSQFSILVWIKTTSTADELVIVAKDDTSTQREWHFKIFFGRLNLVIMSGNSWLNRIRKYADVGFPNDGLWHHVAATWDGSPTGGVSLYIDGGEVPGSYDNAGTFTGVADSAAAVCIGTYSDGVSGPFQGSADELLLYSRRVSLAEIRYDMLNYHNPIRDGLVLWLPLEEGMGLTAYDRSGLGNHGSLLPASSPPTWVRVKQYELRAEARL